MSNLTLPPPTHEAPSKFIRVTICGADTPHGRELATLIRLHPKVDSAREVACDGSVLVGWDAALEPRWSRGPARVLDADVVFVCQPAEKATPVIMDAVECGARVIDLTGCLREARFGLGIPRDAGDGETAYGLPEFSSERLREADHVANAGCVATCATLALGPAAMAGYLGTQVELETTVGLSKPSPDAHATPEEALEEIQENLRDLHRCASEPRLSLERRVDPEQRGVYAKARLEHSELTASRVHALYKTFYADLPCVEVVPRGLPTLPAVWGTNKAQVGIRRTDAGEVEIACAMDDALKGAVGQAIQNMNLMFGFPETLGLPDFVIEAPVVAASPRAMRRPDL